jgi:hypothetical protein
MLPLMVQRMHTVYSNLQTHEKLQLIYLENNLET